MWIMTKIKISLLLFACMAFSLSAKHHKGHGPGMKGPMHGKMLEKMDTDKDGKISKTEWQAHHDEMFAKLDADKDGSITKDEFQAHHSKMMKEHHGKMGKGDDEAQPESPKKFKKGPRKKKHKNDDLQFDGEKTETPE